MSRFKVVRDATRLKVVHRQRVMRQGDADPAPAFERGGLPEPIRAAAAEGWQRLIETEHESVVISGWMTSALARLGAPLDVIGAFGRVVEDEIRHVDVCAQMVEAFGEAPTLPHSVPPPFPTGVEGAAMEEVEFETVAGLVGFFCVFEHLSAHVFRQALEAAEAPIARWALGEIHRDEAFHGAFGFETAKALLPRWKPELRARLGARAVEDIQRFERRLGGPLPEDARKKPTRLELDLERLGLLSGASLLGVFYEATKKELLPRFEELSVPLDLSVARRP